MIIDTTGNGSFLFQSLDPADQSLYTYSQDNSAAFVLVSSIRANTFYANNIVGGPFELTNKFRNGTMDIWQRTSPVSLTSNTPAYTADGWILTSTTGNTTISQVNNTRTNALTISGLQIKGNTSIVDVKMQQRIESYFAFPLAGNTVTVQAQIFNNTGSTITPTITTNSPTATDDWTANTVDLTVTNLQPCPNGVWTQVGYTLTVSANAINGYEIIFDFGNNFSTTGKTIIVAECDIRVTSHTSLGLNSSPPIPEMRFFPFELEFCQRYYAKTFPYATQPNFNKGAVGALVERSGTYSTAAAFAMMWDYPVTMRAIPTVTQYELFNTGNPHNAAMDYFGAAAGISCSPSPSDSRCNVVQAATGGVSFTPAIHLSATSEL